MEVKSIPPTQMKAEVRCTQKFRILKTSNRTPKKGRLIKMLKATLIEFFDQEESLVHRLSRKKRLSRSRFDSVGISSCLSISLGFLWHELA